MTILFHEIWAKRYTFFYLFEMIPFSKFVAPQCAHAIPLMDVGLDVRAARKEEKTAC